MSGELAGRVVLITGGGRGVGRATALAFARAGANICVTARTASQIESVAGDVRSLGAQSLATVADVGRSADIHRLFERVVATFGHIDVLVNNAGSFPVGPIRDFPESEFDAALQVDLKSFFLCSQAALTTGGMLERRSGHIINMGSVSVRRQIPNMAVHCALKAAVLAFSESLRREVAPSGVRVSLLCPGTIDTELVRSQTARNYVHSEDKWLQPEDIAEIILFTATRPRGLNISEVDIVGT
jgi:NAD(P)-dependent dehydrogenase (short-subunit alcohol dehydrogenase family)